MYSDRIFFWLGCIVLLFLLSEFVASEQCNIEGEVRETVSVRTDVIQVCFDSDSDGVMEWTFICFGDDWDREEANVVCRRAGYLFSDYNGLGQHSDKGEGIIKLSDVRCDENSMSLPDCTHSTTVDACNYVAAIVSSCRTCTQANECDGGSCNSMSMCQCVGGCMNGGFCFVGKCICPDGYSGINCETNSPTLTEQITTSVMSTAATGTTIYTENEPSTSVSSIPTTSSVECTSTRNNGVNCSNLPTSQNSASNVSLILGLVIGLSIVSSIAVIVFIAIIIIIVAVVARKASSTKPSKKQEELVLNRPYEVAYSEANNLHSDPSIYATISEPNFYHTIADQAEETNPYEEANHFRPTSKIPDTYKRMVWGDVISPKIYDELPFHTAEQKNQLSEYIEPPSNLPELKDMLYTCLCPHEISERDIEIGEEFASGHFGMVYRGNYHTEKGDIPVAIKTLKETAVTDKDMRVDFMREAAILAQFHHPNVLRLIGILTNDHQPWMMVTELLKTELRQLLIDIKRSPSAPDKLQLQNILLKFSREIAAGMQHLARKKFVHRDLAARNVLVGKDLSVRVADFGMSREIDSENDYYTSSGGRVPLRWTAPEAVFYKKFSESSDVWSFGMTLYEIWSLGDKPWHDYNADEIIEALSTGQTLSQPANCPTQVYQVMLSTWHQGPPKRPKFSELTVALDNINSFPY